MIAETVAEALEREHREIDEGIEEFVAGLAAGEPDPQPLARAVAALRRHIYLEEEFLFPPLREAGLVMPVFVMVREHGQIWKILDALDAELRDGAVAASAAGLLQELQDQLQAHNMKEEHVLYPRSEQVLTEETKAGLQELIDTGRTPEGWVCEGAR
ncbi:hemerythrin domain-containing protein [Streptomyces thermoalcalitolerans]|uniref:Hemerythrin domain-containing protein n=1 Tax=Streptomyces thermoalcalitolerans TaxID=65605 RepID=A0ABN1NJS4_9ACTN